MRIRENKKGFTLIELLAVIVILAILMLVAGTSVFDILNDAEKGAFRTEFLGLLESAQTRASMDLLDGTLSGKNRTKCYKATDLSFDDKGKGYVYSVEVTLNSDGSLNITGWMNSNKYKIENKGVQVTKGDVTQIESDIASIGNCGKTS